MATAKKLPSGKWRCLVYSHMDPDGKRKYKSFTASTKREAEYMAAEFIMDRNRMKDEKNWSLTQAIDAYIESREPTLSPSTISAYRKIQKHSFQDIMEIPIYKITNAMLQNSVNAEIRRKPQNKRSGTLSPKTVKNQYGLISAVLKEYNPGMIYRISLPKQPRQIRSLPLPKDIYEAVKGTDVELPVLLAMWLSFTESEIRGLTKSKSIDGEYITIREVLVVVDGIDVRKEMAKEVTRNRRHRVPEYIKSLIDEVEGDVIVPMSAKTLLRHFRKRLKDAGLPAITFHDLRHVNASLMAKLRIPDKYAQERGGWKTDHVMKSVYTETFSEEREKVDEIIDSYFYDII